MRERLHTEIKRANSENLGRGEGMFESVGNLQSLWGKYRLNGAPPAEGSPVAKRLRENCARYARIAVFPEKVIRPTPLLANHKKVHGGGEDYFAELRQQQEAADFVWRSKTSKTLSPSDTEKRELHNQISLMVMGKIRSGMNDALAHHIANFACELTFGKTIEEFDREKNARGSN